MGIKNDSTLGRGTRPAVLEVREPGAAAPPPRDAAKSVESAAADEPISNENLRTMMLRMSAR